MFDYILREPAAPLYEPAIVAQWQYECIYRHGEVLTQLPFKIKVAMSSTDRRGRGYSDQYIARSKDFTH